MLLHELAATSADVARESGKTAKTALLAGLLRRADPAEVPVAVSYLSGELPQRQIGVGWASLQEVPAAAPEPSVSTTARPRSPATTVPSSMTRTPSSGPVTESRSERRPRGGTAAARSRRPR